MVSPKLLVSPVVAHSLQTITEVEAWAIDCEQLREKIAEDPDLRQVFNQLWYGQNLYCDERIIELGRLNAIEKASAFLMRLIRKMESIEPNPDHQYVVPITREIISDTLGLMPVHVSRTMKHLEVRGRNRMGSERPENP